MASSQVSSFDALGLVVVGRIADSDAVIGDAEVVHVDALGRLEGRAGRLCRLSLGATTWASLLQAFDVLLLVLFGEYPWSPLALFTSVLVVVVGFQVWTATRPARLIGALQLTSAASLLFAVSLSTVMVLG